MCDTNLYIKVKRKQTIKKEKENYLDMSTQGMTPQTEKETKENKIIAAFAIAIAAVMAVVSWFTLPEFVESQPEFWDTGVPALPKAFAVLFPLGLTTFCALGAITYRKQFVTCLLGYALYIIFWLLN